VIGQTSQGVDKRDAPGLGVLEQRQKPRPSCLGRVAFRLTDPVAPPARGQPGDHLIGFLSETAVDQDDTRLVERHLAVQIIQQPQVAQAPFDDNKVILGCKGGHARPTAFGGATRSVPDDPVDVVTIGAIVPI